MWDRGARTELACRFAGGIATGSLARARFKPGGVSRPFPLDGRGQARGLKGEHQVRLHDNQRHYGAAMGR